MKYECRLEGCNHEAPSPQSRGAHERWHVTNREAIRGPDGGLIRIADQITPAAPSQSTGLTCEICARKFTSFIGCRIHMGKHVTNGEAKWKGAAPKPGERGELVPIGTELAKSESHGLDLSKLTPTQLTSLRQDLGVDVLEPEVVEPPHSCTTTRGLDMMKRAVVLVSLAEIVENMPDPSHLLQMVGTISQMPIVKGKRAR